jgi:hypothetical protein
MKLQEMNLQEMKSEIVYLTVFVSLAFLVYKF